MGQVGLKNVGVAGKKPQTISRLVAEFSSLIVLMFTELQMCASPHQTVKHGAGTKGSRRWNFPAERTS